MTTQQIAPTEGAGKHNLLDPFVVTVALYRSGKGYGATLRRWRERDGGLTADITIHIPRPLADDLAEYLGDVIGDPRCSTAVA